MCAKVKQLSLVLGVQVEDQTDSTTTQRNHGCCLVICLSDVGLEELGVVYANLLGPGSQTCDLLEVSLCLDELTIHEIVNGRGEDLAHVNGVELVCQHPAGSRDHEVAGEDRGGRPIDLVCCLYAPPRVGFVDDVVLKE